MKPGCGKRDKLTKLWQMLPLATALAKEQEVANSKHLGQATVFSLAPVRLPARPSSDRCVASNNHTTTVLDYLHHGSCFTAIPKQHCPLTS